VCAAVFSVASPDPDSDSDPTRPCPTPTPTRPAPTPTPTPTPARPRPRLRPHPTDPDQARPRPDHERIATCEGKLAPGKQINTADNRATTCWGSWTLDSKQHSRRRDHELLGQLGPRKTNDTAGRWTATCREGLAPGKRINTLGRRSTTCRGQLGPTITNHQTRTRDRDLRGATNTRKSVSTQADARQRPAGRNWAPEKQINASGNGTPTCWGATGPGETNQHSRAHDATCWTTGPRQTHQHSGLHDQDLLGASGLRKTNRHSQTRDRDWGPGRTQPETGPPTAGHNWPRKKSTQTGNK